LINKGVDVSRHQRNGSLILLDFNKIIDNPYLGVPAAFGLKEFVSKIQSRIIGKTLVVIADMSIYNHVKNGGISTGIWSFHTLNMVLKSGRNYVYITNWISISCFRKNKNKKCSTFTKIEHS
jgi:hypothetical protein